MFKTPTELKITPREHAALIKVMGWLKDGSLRGGDDGQFDMSQICEVSICGTVACIGGWVFLARQGIAVGAGALDDGTIDRADKYVSSDRSPALKNLYYPEDRRWAWEAITASEAATAIANFLATGYPSWSSVVAERTGGKDA